MRSSHANAFYHSLLMVVAFEVLTKSLSVNLMSGGSWPYFYLPVLARIYHDWPSWRRGFLLWLVEYVSSEHYCQPKVFSSWYMWFVEPLQSLQARPTWLLCYTVWHVQICSTQIDVVDHRRWHSLMMEMEVGEMGGSSHTPSSFSYSKHNTCHAHLTCTRCDMRA